MSNKPTFWPAPIAWEDAPAIASLVVALRDSDASIYALRLWHHRRRCGATLSGPHARAVVEVVCKWRKKAGRLVDSLIACGFIRVDGAGLEILPWESVAFVDWTRSGADDDDAEGEEPEAAPVAAPAPEPVEDADERVRRLARERKQRERDAKRDGVTVERDAERDERDSERDMSRGERDGSVTERDENRLEAPPSPRADTRTTETDTGTSTKTEVEVQEPLSGKPDGALFGEPAQQHPDTERVWSRYAAMSPKSKRTPERIALIRKMLKVYSADDLLRCIDGYAKSPHHNGKNDKGTKYLSIELFFRSAQFVEAGWKYLEAGPAIGKRLSREDSHMDDSVFDRIDAGAMP